MTAHASDAAGRDTGRPRRRRRWWLWLAGPFIGLLAVLTGGYALLGTQAALDYVLRRVVADADGHLTIEGAEGSAAVDDPRCAHRMAR